MVHLSKPTLVQDGSLNADFTLGVTSFSTSALFCLGCFTNSKEASVARRGCVKRVRVAEV